MKEFFARAVEGLTKSLVIFEGFVIIKDICIKRKK